MNRNRRTSLVVVVAAVVVLATSGIVYASSASTASRTDTLVLNGHLPRFVELGVTLATGGAFQTSGTISIDAAHSAVSAQLQVPIVTASTTFEVRALRGRVYLTSPNLADAGGPVWYTLPLKLPQLSRFAHYLLKPNPAILSLLANAGITHHGYATTYELQRPNVALGSFGVRSGSAALKGTLDVRLTTGRQGEVTAIWASMASSSATTTVELRVLSYNRPVSVVAPPAARATSSALPLLRQLISSGALGSLVLPAQLLKLVGGAKLS